LPIPALPVSDFADHVLHWGNYVMREKLCAALLIVPFFLGTEAAAEDWPPLPKQGFMSGRVATPADVAAGNAVFSTAVGGGAVGKSTPIRIEIPQYAYYREGGTKSPVIVLQAERVDIQGANAVQMDSVGAVKPDGKKFVGLLTSFELLGRNAPPLSPVVSLGPGPKDQTPALSDLSQIFYEDPSTFGRQHLDRRRLDFSVESLRHVNQYLEAIRKDKDVEKQGVTRAKVVLRAGAYVGEVIRKNDNKVQWHWIDHEGAMQVEPKLFESFGKTIATAAVLYDGKKGFVFPLGKVEKYLNNGAEDDVYFFAKVIMSHEK
jgi:hypothetical protein